jgi:uncharacterized lipoprotein YddW (UPF0748 family)
MKRFIILYAFLMTVLTFTAHPKHEVRAVWLTTIGGLDFPSSYAHDGMGIKAQQQELCHILDRLKAVNVNTVLFHTRVRATTSYPSDIEPWDGSFSGKPGEWPGYDVLQFVIDECHRRGMELHAWVVTIPIGKWNVIGCRELRKKYPSMLRRIGEEGFMNPESPMTAEYLTELCAEITQRYDIDGIHLDYIRYPETWPLAKNNSERAVRRRHITHIVECIHDRVKRLKPWVKMSCSPVGKYDDLSRYPSRGWNAYNRVSQEAQAWLRDGLMDQLYPMMYFAGNQFYPFAIDWQEQSAGRTVAAGLGIYMLHPNERNWRLGEVQRQLNVSRSLGMGHCYFRAKFLLDNVKGLYDFMKEFDAHPALIPPMTWAQSLVPSPPTTLQVRHTAQGDELTWHGARDNSDGPYLLYNIYASTETPVDVTKAENLLATRYLQSQLSIKRTEDRLPLHYAVTALDRYGNESAPVYETVVAKPLPSSSILIANDGKTLKLPDNRGVLDAQYVVVQTLQGTLVTTLPYTRQINISLIPEGIYELKSLNRKGITHRLGFFIKKNRDH